MKWFSWRRKKEKLQKELKEEKKKKTNDELRKEMLAKLKVQRQPKRGMFGKVKYVPRCFRRRWKLAQKKKEKNEQKEKKISKSRENRREDEEE